MTGVEQFADSVLAAQVEPPVALHRGVLLNVEAKRIIGGLADQIVSVRVSVEGQPFECAWGAALLTALQNGLVAGDFVLVMFVSGQPFAVDAWWTGV